MCCAQQDSSPKQLAAFCVLSTAGLHRSQERVEGFLENMVSLALKGCGPGLQDTPQPGVCMDPVLNEREDSQINLRGSGAVYALMKSWICCVASLSLRRERSP